MTLPDSLAASLGEHMLRASDVANAAGITTARVHQIDSVLSPIRLANGQKRYSPRVVDAFLQKRATGGAR